MDYKNFLDNYNTYNEWNRVVKREADEEKKLCQQDLNFDQDVNNLFPHLTSVPDKPTVLGGLSNLGIMSNDTISFNIDDRVNSPSHYTKGKQEVIDIIEDAITDAPTMSAGMLQGQVLKYMLRCWLKDNPIEDLKKAQWYLNRLISQMEVRG